MSDGTDRRGGPPRPAPKRYEDQPTGAVPVESKPGTVPKGVRNALIVIGAVVLAATASALFGFFVLADRADEESKEIVGSDDCSFIEDGELSAGLGTDVDAFQLGVAGGLGSAIADNRIALDGETCLATSGDVDISVSLTRAELDDAKDVFRSQVVVAQAADGGGNPFLEKDLPDLGDEAFCTTPDTIGYTGVLARSGDTVVYASVAAPTLATTPDAACDLAAKAARATLDA